MSSPYTGNPTAAQAPSPAPGPAVDPIVELPVDGDALNAASVAQAMKVPADYTAYSDEIVSGDITLKKVDVTDGTGGGASTAAAGTVKAHRFESDTRIGGTSTPTPTPVTDSLYADLIPYAWARVSQSAGTYTFEDGVNISAISKTGTGIVKVTLINAVPSQVRAAIFVMLYNQIGTAATAFNGVSTTEINVDILNSSFTAVDAGFSLLVFIS